MRVDIKQINEVIKDYFNHNTEIEKVPVKKLMPSFIKAGIFDKDKRKGLPIRNVLKELDREDALATVPTVYADRNEEATYWYFIKPGIDHAIFSQEKQPTKRQLAKKREEESDSKYILDLCDEALDMKGARQHTFEFLLGDYHKDGLTRTMLILDLYYPKLNLVIELRGKVYQDTSERESEITVSGVTRAEQRKIYNQRKVDVLAKEEVNYLEIEYYLFQLDSENKIIRNHDADLKVVQEALSEYMTINK